MNPNLLKYLLKNNGIEIEKNALDSGASSGVYVISNNQQRILRVTKLKSFDKNKIEKEIYIWRLMGKYGIGPNIHSTFYNKKFLCIEMDRLDGIICQDSDIKNIINQIEELNMRMIQLGYFHGDLNQWNICYKNVAGQKRIYFVDFESTFSFLKLPFNIFKKRVKTESELMIDDKYFSVVPTKEFINNFKNILKNSQGEYDKMLLAAKKNLDELKQGEMRKIQSRAELAILRIMRKGY